VSSGVLTYSIIPTPAGKPTFRHANSAGPREPKIRVLTSFFKRPDTLATGS
jgi:hypothetical protein